MPIRTLAGAISHYGHDAYLLTGRAGRVRTRVM